MPSKESKYKFLKSGSGRSAYLGFLVSLACIVWVFSSIELGLIVSNLKEVDLIPILGAVLVTACSYILRSIRWVFFFSENAPKLLDSYKCLILGFFMNNMLPARMGELVRAHFGGKVTGLSRANVLGTIVGERLADGLMISFIFVLLFSVSQTDGQSFSSGMYIVVYMFVVVGLLMTIALWKSEQLFQILKRIDKKLSGRSAYPVLKARKFLEGLEPLKDLRKLFPIIILSFIVWFSELLVYFLVADAFNANLDLSGLALFLAAVNFSSLVPAAPGGIGVIEAFATFALVSIGIVKELAFSMVATQHVIQIVVVGVAGSIVLFRYFGGKIPEADTLG